MDGERILLKVIFIRSYKYLLTADFGLGPEYVVEYHNSSLTSIFFLPAMVFISTYQPFS